MLWKRLPPREWEPRYSSLKGNSVSPPNSPFNFTKSIGEPGFPFCKSILKIKIIKNKLYINYLVDPKIGGLGEAFPQKLI
jgi:hypothetical protein